MQELTDFTCIRPEADEKKLRLLRTDAFGNDHLVALAAYMNAAGNETRLRILYSIWKGGELCVCDLADILGISQPAASRHLKILKEKALVTSRRDAQTIYYSVCNESPFGRLLVRFFEESETDNITLSLG